MRRRNDEIGSGSACRCPDRRRRGARRRYVRADATETPLTTACPAGYDLLSVDALEAAGPYVKPRRIDTSGNNNGYVCGLALPDSVRTASCKLGSAPACALAAVDLPVYAVKDDDNPASQNAQVDE
jgi:hypothetical protein